MKTTRPFRLIASCAAICMALFLSSPSARAQDPPVLVYSIGKDVQEPKLQEVAVVPSDAGKCQKEPSGKVTLSIIVDASGHPRNIIFIKPLANDLDKLALVVVEADRFQPAMREGTPVSASLSVEVKLKGCLVQSSDGAWKLSLHGTPVQKFNKDDSRQGETQFAPETDASQKPGEKGAKTFKAGSGVSAPILLKAPEAEYTDLARRERINAACLVTVVVDRYGLPINLRVAKPAGYGLDKNAMDAVTRYRFKPAMRDGEPVPVIVTIEVNFRIVRK